MELMKEPPDTTEEPYEDDAIICWYCDGNGTDAMADHLLPCPYCAGE